MNIRLKALAVLASAALAGASGACAQGLGGLIGNLVEGVFSKSDLTLADIVGTYQSEGPAVSFKSDNFLKKAGGVAAAAVVEEKLAPYYEQYGFNNARFEVAADSTFTLSMKMLSIGGTITGNGDGTFECQFTLFGRIPMGSATAYISKGPSTLSLMFDATKFKNMLQAISKYVNMKSLKAVSEILGAYDGLCVGFRMKPEGTASKGNAGSSHKTGSGNSDSGGNARTGLDALKDILNKKSK